MVMFNLQTMVLVLHGGQEHQSNQVSIPKYVDETTVHPHVSKKLT